MEKESLEKCNQCFVGKIKSPLHSFSIQKRVYNMGFFSVKTILMGADLVLISSEDFESLNVIFEDSKEIWESMFCSIERWRPSLVAKERLVWLRVSGTPIHAWGQKFFKFLVFGKGQYIDLDETRSEKDMMLPEF